VNATACKRLLSLGCVAHTDGAVFKVKKFKRELAKLRGKDETF